MEGFSLDASLPPRRTRNRVSTPRELIESSSDEPTPGSTYETPIKIEALNRWISQAIAANVPKLWVEGEVSDFVASRSGHLYFTLKDSSSQVRAVIWRSAAERLKFRLEDGQAIIVFGRVDLYSPRGTYQIVIDRVEPQGIGALQLAFQQMFRRLEAEGLFETSRKRELPKFPKRIGFVTSPSGAALQDFLEVLRRRWQGTNVLVVPCRVQGEGSAMEIATSIRLAAKLRPALDCLVVGRGGGALEDLWSFNEEVVVRAIFESPIPTISAVGHEIDVTLCDLAADVRALTPSEAAEIVVPSSDELRIQLDTLSLRSRRSLDDLIRRAYTRLDSVASRPVIVRPIEMLQTAVQRVDELSSKLDSSIARQLNMIQEKVGRLASSLDALSPLKTLTRGYSISSTLNDDQRPITSTSDLVIGQSIQTLLAQGKITSLVTHLDHSSTTRGVAKE